MGITGRPTSMKPLFQGGGALLMLLPHFVMALEPAHAGQGAGRQHRRQRGGEDEPMSVGADWRR